MRQTRQIGWVGPHPVFQWVEDVGSDPDQQGGRRLTGVTCKELVGRGWLRVDQNVGAADPFRTDDDSIPHGQKRPRCRPLRRAARATPSASPGSASEMLKWIDVTTAVGERVGRVENHWMKFPIPDYLDPHSSFFSICLDQAIPIWKKQIKLLIFTFRDQFDDCLLPGRVCRRRYCLKTNRVVFRNISFQPSSFTVCIFLFGPDATALLIEPE